MGAQALASSRPRPGAGSTSGVVSAPALQASVSQRGIRYLFHYSRLENLASIMQYGLLSRRETTRRGIDAVFSDLERLDNRINRVCLSISRPNWLLEIAWHHRYLGAEWILLQLDARVL